MEQWLAEHEYESVDQLKGSVSRQHAIDPSAYERANSEMKLILTGALHLAGKDGLLTQLRQHGYKVEPF